MASADFLVNGAPNPAAHVVAYGATVNLALISTVGINDINWSIPSTSKSGVVVPTITPAGSPLGATASFPMVSNPGDNLGRGFVVRCHAVDNAGNNLFAHGVVGALNGAGIVPFCVDERNYRHATMGWAEDLNFALANGGSGGGGSVNPVNAIMTHSGGTAINGIAVSVTLTSDPINTKGQGYAIQARWTGAGSGSFKLQYSNDPYDLPPNAATWADVPLSTMSTGDGSPLTWDVIDARYASVRLVYTPSAGEIVLTVRSLTAG